MKERRPLTEGLRPDVDPKAAEEFIYPNKSKQPEAATPEPTPAASTRLAAGTINRAAQSVRVPIGGRIPLEMQQAVKRASFERQLQGVEPNTVQDILEDALKPWLRKHGYMP